MLLNATLLECKAFLAVDATRPKEVEDVLVEHNISNNRWMVKGCTILLKRKTLHDSNTRNRIHIFLPLR